MSELKHEGGMTKFESLALDYVYAELARVRVGHCQQPTERSTRFSFENECECIACRQGKHAAAFRVRTRRRARLALMKLQDEARRLKEGSRE